MLSKPAPPRAGCCKDIPSAAELVERLWRECEAASGISNQRLRRILSISGVQLAQIPRRRSIFAHVKFLSRLFTALNLLPSIATLAFESRPIRRHSSTNRAQTFLMAPPLGGGSCTKLRNATTRSWAVGYDDDQQPAALCSMRFVRRPVQRHRGRRAMLDPRMFRRAALRRR